jgi:RNA polymerase sigma-70 factor (ECF subfamily)
MVVEESEEALIERCRHADPEAFRALFERHKNRVYSIALRYSGDEAAAQDITQEAFLKVFVGIKGFRGKSQFSSWLYRLVVNSCLDQKRKRSRLQPLLDDAWGMIQSPHSGTLDDVLRGELSSQVQAVVAGLNDEQRILIVLRYTECLSYEEIAGILGCSTGTIASRLSRIHKTLERRLLRIARREGLQI